MLITIRASVWCLHPFKNACCAIKSAMVTLFGKELLAKIIICVTNVCKSCKCYIISSAVPKLLQNAFSKVDNYSDIPVVIPWKFLHRPTETQIQHWNFLTMPTYFHNKILKVLNNKCPISWFRIKIWHEPKWLLNTWGWISSSTQLLKITSKIWIIWHWLPKLRWQVGKNFKNVCNIQNRMQNGWHIWHGLPDTADIGHRWQNSWGTWHRLQNTGYLKQVVKFRLQLVHH